MISPADISGYIGAVEQQDREHWASSYVADKNYWRMKYSGSVPACDIYVELNGPCLCLQTDLGELRMKPECETALYLFLLRLNEDLPAVKFGIREGGRITLMAEPVASQVSLGVFEELVEVLVSVLTQYRREIELLASDPALAELVMKSLTRSAVTVTLIEHEAVS